MNMDISRAIFIVVVISQTVQAFPPYPYDLYVLGPRSSVSEAVSIRPLKFQEWYPELEAALNGASTTSCQLSLQAYLGNMTARIDLLGIGYGAPNYCSLHNDCILSTVYSSAVAHMAAASVLLGLTPSILASLGPTISEISLLSSYRPFLSLLLAMGAPAAFPSRLLPYSNPLQLLQKTSGFGLGKVRQTTASWAAALSSIQYLVAGFAIWNIIATSLQVGRRTVISWQCEASWLPLIWSLIPILIHAPAAFSFKLHQRMVKKINRSTQSEGRSSEKGSFLQLMGRNLTRMLKNEIGISGNVKNLFVAVEVAEPGVWVMGLQSLTVLLTVLQIVFGTAVFSSLLYIGIADAAYLFLRYAASALVCRIIIYVEVGGMARAVQKGEVE